jgi:hypothetical protein
LGRIRFLNIRVRKGHEPVYRTLLQGDLDAKRSLDGTARRLQQSLASA